MKPELVEFKVEHLAAGVEWAAMNERRHLIALTALLDGRPIGSAGISRAYGRVYVAWAIFSDEIRRHPKWLHQTALTYLAAVRRLAAVERIEALAIKRQCRNCEWLERLGFQWESAALKAGPNGEDCARYYWVRG